MSSVSIEHRRALRDAALNVLAAQRDRADAIVAAHAAGGSIQEIAQLAAMDAFTVRDVLAAAGVVPALQPKETAARAR